MSFEITERAQEGVVILTLKGRLTVGEATPVREKVNQVLASGCNKIILDLSGWTTSIQPAWGAW